MKTAIVCLSILLLLVICIASFEATIIFKLKEQNEQAICLIDVLYRRLSESRGFPSDNETTLRYVPSTNFGKPIIENGHWVGE
jgi:hypothetical protein